MNDRKADRSALEVCDIAPNRSADLIQELLEDRESGARPVLVLDFDGVLAGSTPDKIYRLDYDASAEIRLTEASRLLGVKTAEDDLRYRRFLTYEAAALELKLPIEPGPFLPVAKSCQEFGIPWFVVSARAGPAATQRLSEFLRTHELQPDNVFYVGRVSKDRQIIHVADKYKPRKIYIVEDNPRDVNDLERNLNDIPIHAEKIHIKKAEHSKTNDENAVLHLCYSVIEVALAKKDNSINQNRTVSSDFMRMALSHADAQFAHYASQRLVSLRLYLIIVGVTFGAIFSVLMEDVRSDFLLYSAIFGITVSILFLLLEIRNEQLVNTSEKALRSLENEMSLVLSNKNLRIIENTDLDFLGLRKLIRYSVIGRFIFLTIISIFMILIIVVDLAAPYTKVQ